MRKEIKLLFIFIAFSMNACVEGSTAQKLDEKNMCWGESKTFYVSSSEACEEASVIATDKNGAYWHFHHNCIPEDFDQVQNPTDEMILIPNC